MLINSLIIGLSSLTYIIGVRSTLDGTYKPNVYSRIIWFLLAVNGLAGLLVMDVGFGQVALGSILAIGSLAVLLASLRHSIFRFGKVELIATVLLGSSLLLWATTDLAPLNVGITLIAHLIGGIPTLIAVIKKPSVEKTSFWFYFAVASALSLAVSDLSSFQNYMFPLYYMLFNSVIVGLSIRKKHH